MYEFFKNKKYYFLIIIQSILLAICIFVIFSNLQNEKIKVENIINSFTSFLMGIIAMMSITFNLMDNEKLRNESKDLEKKEANRITVKNNNIRLLISNEIFNNLKKLNDYNSKINMDDKSILMKPECSNTAWKFLYTNLPEAFNENELKILIKFYEKIEDLLDDESWLKFNNAKYIGAFENIRMEIEFTEEDFEEAKIHKKFIKEIITEVLSYEKDLSFLKIKFYH